MDHQHDTDKFRKLLAGLCDLMGKPFTEELVATWWRALLDVPFAQVQAAVERFNATATDKTRFPRPGQMRPEDKPIGVEGDPVRDYWRNSIVGEVARQLGQPFGHFLGLITVHRATLGKSLALLLDEFTAQDKQTGRTHKMHADLVSRCEEIAAGYRHLASEKAPIHFTRKAVA